MKEQEKNKSKDKTDIYELDELDSTLDPLDFNDLDIDDSLLSTDYQKIDESAEEGIETKGKEPPEDFIREAKNILEKMKSKPEPDPKKIRQKKISKHIIKKLANKKPITKLDTKFHVIELMVEELGNLGLDIKIIKEMILESKKFLEKGDFEAAESLINNSKIFASNLWLEHRINLISAIITFIETFIFNFSDVEMDYKTSKKYFKQARVFLDERDLLLANKYLDNTIQNVSRSWESTRKKKLDEAFEYLKYWLKEEESLEIDFPKLKGSISKAKTAFANDELDKAEQYLKGFMTLAAAQINGLTIILTKKEDLIQELEGIYDFDNFTSLDESIAKAGSMLLESLNNDNIQLQLNSLLTVYKTLFDMEKKGIDTSKMKELFSTAKETFEKEDYGSVETILKNVMALLKKDMSGKTDEVQKQAAEEEETIEKKAAPGKISVEPVKLGLSDKQIDSLSPEEREIYNSIRSLKKDIEFVKGIKKTGEDIVEIETLIDAALNEFMEKKLKDAMILIDKSKKLINTLKNDVLAKKAKVTIDSTKDIIFEASEFGVDVEEAEQTLESAEVHLNIGEFEKAIDESLQSQQHIETLREKHQYASDILFKTKLFLDKVPEDNDKPPELENLFLNAELALRDHDYDLEDFISSFITEKIQELKVGKSIDRDLIKEFDKAITSMVELKDEIKRLETMDIDISGAMDNYQRAREELKNLNMEEVTRYYTTAMKIISGDEKPETLEGKELEVEEELASDVTEKVPLDDIDMIELPDEPVEGTDEEPAENIDQEVYANDLIKKLTLRIMDAKQDQVDTKETEDLLNFAKQRHKTENYSEVIDILQHSQDILDETIETRLKEKAVELMRDGSKTLGSLQIDESEKEKLKELWSKAKEEFNNKEFENSILASNQFFDLVENLDMDDDGSKPTEEPLVTDSEETVDHPEQTMALDEQPGTEDILDDELDGTSEDSEMSEVKTIDMEPSDIPEETIEKRHDEIEDLSEVNHELDMDATGEGVESEEYDNIGESPKEPYEMLTEEMGLDVSTRIEHKRTGKMTKSKTDEMIKRAFGFMKEKEKDERDEELSQTEIRERRIDDKYKLKAGERELMAIERKHKKSITDHEELQEEVTEEEKPTKTEFKPPGPEERSSKVTPSQEKIRHTPQYPSEHDEIPETYNETIEDFEGISPKEEYLPSEDVRPRGEFNRHVDQEDEYSEEMFNKRRAQQRGGEDMYAPRRRQPTHAPTERYYSEQRRPPPQFRGQSRKAGFGPTVTIDHSSRRSMREAPEEFLDAEQSRAEFGFSDENIVDSGVRQAKHKKRLSSLKKEALKGLQDIQAIISTTYHFGAKIDELERISDDARDAFDDGDFQEVLLYVDKSEEISRRLKITYMDGLISDIKYSGENTEYLEYLIRETEKAFDEERYKIGDELCRRCMNLVKDLKHEKKISKQNHIYCRYCGNTITPDSTFCSICGEKLY